MILYFDNRITNDQLMPKGFYSELDRIRDSDSNYKLQDRFDIAMYCLASHSEIKWSEIIIKYEIVPEDKTKRRIFEKFVKELWPKAKIIYGQSVKINQYREMAKQINSSEDDWIFYAANNDHPLVAPTLDTFNKCMEKAKKLNQNKKCQLFIHTFQSHWEWQEKEPLFMT